MPRRHLIVALAMVLALLLPATAFAQIGNTFGNTFSLSATLNGNNEVPAGDPDGFGYARVTIFTDTGQLCFQLSVTRIEPPTAAHIHEGAAGVNGPIVVPLEAPVGGLARGCVEVDTALLAEIAANPGNYYVNVHNAEYPGGAVRGQLMGTGRGAPLPLPPVEPEIELVVDGLDNPRGVDMANDAVHLAEAGSGGDDCFNAGTDDDPYELCVGLTGAVTMVTNGTAEQVGDNLPSLADASGMFATGPHDTATDADGNVYVVTGLGATSADRDSVAVDIEAAADFGKLLMLAEDGTWTEIADIAAYEFENNPAGDYYVNQETGEPDTEAPNLESNPYSVVPFEDGFLVADAGANAVFYVGMDGTISTYAIFPAEMVEAPDFLGLPPGTMIPMDAVPTAVAVGPDGAVYVGQLTGFPFPVGGAKVWRLEDVDGDGDALEDGEQTVYAEGLTAIVDIEFGPDGTLYVVEFAKRGLLAAESPDADEDAQTGAIIAIAEDGTHTQVVNVGLILPGGVAVADDGSLYVTNFSVFSSMNDGPNGQLVHVMMADPVPDFR